MLKLQEMFYIYEKKLDNLIKTFGYYNLIICLKQKFWEICNEL